MRFSSLGSKLPPQIFGRDSRYFAVLSLDQHERLTFYVLTVVEPKVQIKVATQFPDSEAPSWSPDSTSLASYSFPSSFMDI